MPTTVDELIQYLTQFPPGSVVEYSKLKVKTPEDVFNETLEDYLEDWDRSTVDDWKIPDGFMHVHHHEFLVKHGLAVKTTEEFTHRHGSKDVLWQFTEKGIELLKDFQKRQREKYRCLYCRDQRFISVSPAIVDVMQKKYPNKNIGVGVCDCPECC